jgi:hypothetical protein
VGQGGLTHLGGAGGVGLPRQQHNVSAADWFRSLRPNDLLAAVRDSPEDLCAMDVEAIQGALERRQNGKGLRYGRPTVMQIFDQLLSLTGGVVGHSVPLPVRRRGCGPPPVSPVWHGVPLLLGA